MPVSLSLRYTAVSSPQLTVSRIRGYDTADALLTGPETRTSSPVRMTRGEDLFGLGCSGIIPCGEGAGYAGGIMSAAVDGIRAAFRIMEEFLPE